MSKRVYGLKRATPRMKYQHMRHVMDWKEDLKANQDAEAERRAALRDQFADALDTLKALDPAGWEAWYDDDENIPEYIEWGSCEPVIEKIEQRIVELREAEGGKQKTDGFNWRVASANTLRSYERAAKDFETATKTRVEQADFGKMQAWHAEMKRRGLASNTIRTRIAAVRILSGVEYPIPPKEKNESKLLDLEQVQAVLKQADLEERTVLVKVLTVGTGTAKRHPQDDFRAYFLGEMEQVTAQALTRLIKRCAGKAGLVERQVNLRMWVRSGAALLKTMSPAEFAEALPHANTPVSVDWKKRLHGIGRRSNHLLKA